MTQGFFAHFLEKKLYARADPLRGRFRAFLLTCCSNFVGNHRPAPEPPANGIERVDELSPDKLFERAWALKVIERALSALTARYEHNGKETLLNLIKPALVGDQDTTRYAEIAGQLSMTENAVKKAAQEARRQLRDLVRQAVSATLDSPDTLEDELRCLRTAVARH